MKLDSEVQRRVILDALLHVQIQGDFEGISQMIAPFAQVIQDVRAAEIEEVPTEGRNLREA
jgi:hypothetical protein